MGKIKNSKLKRTTYEVLQKYPDEFYEDFEKNKKKLHLLIDYKSKKLRNIIAGYITRIQKNKDIYMNKIIK